MSEQKLTVESAKEMGASAFDRGIKAAALDPQFMTAYKSLGTLQVGDGLPYLNAWVSGWSARHAASTPAIRV